MRGLIQKLPANASFCWLYISILLFCIFFKIEFWPFSNYRVFQDANNPEHISAYRLGLVNESGKRTWLFNGKKNAQIFSQIVFSLPEKKEKVKKFLIKEILKNTKPSMKYKNIILFRHKITLDKHRIKKIEIIPYMRIPN